MLEISITLRVDYDTANKRIKEPVIKKKALSLAKELITIAELTADSRRPQISVQIGDMFATTEEIKLVDDE